MKPMMDRIRELVDAYNPQFAAHGVRVEVFKRYFETKVLSAPRNSERATPLLSTFEEVYYDRKEKQYRGQNNRYHVTVLRFIPSSKAKSSESYPEYSFWMKKVERAHRGMKPEKKQQKEDKLLKKIERRLQKMLFRCSKKQIRKDTFLDAFRYSFSVRYAYKKQILGKDKLFWDIGVAVVTALVFLLICLCISLLCP